MEYISRASWQKQPPEPENRRVNPDNQPPGLPGQPFEPQIRSTTSRSLKPERTLIAIAAT
jgi:hypothetical protein